MSGSIRLHPQFGLNPTMPVCFFCGKDKGEIALLGAAYQGEVPMHLCIDKEPCQECQKLMAQGVLLIAVKDGTDQDNPYRTGAQCVIKPEAAQRMFNNIDSSRVAFIEDAVWDKIGLPR